MTRTVHLNASSRELEFFPATSENAERLSLFTSPVSAGFPSPAEDYEDGKLDLQQLVVKRPASTFFVRVKGNSMTGAGIHDGDVLVVDRSLPAINGKIVIGVVNGEFTVKRIRREGQRVFLQPENPSFAPIEITGDEDFTVWGVVTWVIHKA